MSFEEQIVPKDKYPSIFSPQRETNVFIMSFKSFTQRGVYSRISPSFSWGIFGHVMCLDQLCTSEKI